MEQPPDNALFCLEGFNAAAVPLRATAGADMTIEEAGARQDWPGKRHWSSL
jgi:hypothetical protein